MSEYVLDASALLAVMLGESGAERIAPLMPIAMIGAVNLSEVAAKLQDYGVPDGEIDENIVDLDLTVVPFDDHQALAAGKLRALTRAAGLSLGDRACLALAMTKRATAVTMDRAWSELDLPLTVEVMR